jgi:hypothetical protein
MTNHLRIATALLILTHIMIIASLLSASALYGIPVSPVENRLVLSPNKNWSVSVQNNKENIPMLALRREPSGKSQELLYVQGSGWVSWAPDSSGFAFTDAVFANHYFIHLCGVNDSGGHCRDISSKLEQRIKARLSRETEIDKIYSKALKWLSPTTLLVGIHVVTNPKMKPGQTYAPVYYSFEAFVVAGERVALSRS